MHDNQWSGMEFDFLKQLKSKCSLYSIMSNDPFCDIDLKILVDWNDATIVVTKNLIANQMYLAYL